MTAISKVFVAGAGLMGHGIAQVHAAIGKQVTLYEPDLARAEAGRDRIAGNLQRAVDKGRLNAADRDATLARISPTGDVGSVTHADLVIEAVFEDLAVKTVARERAVNGSLPWAVKTSAQRVSVAVVSGSQTSTWPTRVAW